MDIVSVDTIIRAFCMLMSMFVALISMTTFFISYVYRNLQAGILRLTYRTKWNDDVCYLFSHVACLSFFVLYFMLMLFLFACVI